MNHPQFHSISTFKCVYALPGFGIYSHRVLGFFFFLVLMWLLFKLHFSQESQDLTRNPRVQIWFNNWKKQTRWANVDFIMKCLAFATLRTFARRLRRRPMTWTHPTLTVRRPKTNGTETTDVTWLEPRCGCFHTSTELRHGWFESEQRPHLQQGLVFY